MGSRTGVRARGNGIEINFQYLGVTRFEHINLKPIARNLNSCSVMRENIIQKIKDGTFNYLREFPDSKTAKALYKEQGGSTVGEALNEWIDRVKDELKHSTWTDYKNSVSTLDRELGAILLPELTRRKVRDYIYSLDVSQKRASNLLIPLRAVLREAHEDFIIETDPLKDWRPKIQKKEHKSEVDPFTIEEQKAFRGEDEIHAFVQFAIWSGLRTSEQLALTWADVTDEINVDKGLVKGVTAPPKTKSSIRKVALRPKALEALKLMNHTRFQKDRIFTYRDDHQVRKLFVRLCKASDVRYRKPYNTRHTFASMMLSAGENAMWVAQQMGHSDVNLIFRTYGHYIPSDRDEGALVDDMFGE